MQEAPPAETGGACLSFHAIRGLSFRIRNSSPDLTGLWSRGASSRSVRAGPQLSAAEAGGFCVSDEWRTRGLLGWHTRTGGRYERPAPLPVVERRANSRGVEGLAPLDAIIPRMRVIVIACGRDAFARHSRIRNWTSAILVLEFNRGQPILER